MGYTVKGHWKTPRKGFKHTWIPSHWVDDKGKRHLKKPKRRKK